MRNASNSDLNSWPISSRLRVYILSLLFAAGAVIGLLLGPLHLRGRRPRPEP